MKWGLIIALISQSGIGPERAMIAMIYPEKRFYPVAKMPTTEAGIDYRFLRDVYVVLGDAQGGGSDNAQLPEAICELDLGGGGSNGFWWFA